MRGRGFLKYHYVKCLDIFQTKHLVKHDPVLIFLFSLASKDCFERGMFSSASVTKTCAREGYVCPFFCLKGEKDLCDVSPGFCKYYPCPTSQNLLKASTMMTLCSTLSFPRLQNFIGLVAWSSLPLLLKDTPV